MDFDAREVRIERRRPQVLEALGAGADQCDRSRECVLRKAAVEHVARGNEAEGLGLAAERDQRHAVFVHRHGEAAHVERVERALAVEVRGYAFGLDHRPHYRERKGRVITGAVALHHGYPAHLVIGIVKRIDVTAGRGGLSQRGQGRDKAVLGLDSNQLAGDVGFAKKRRREHALRLGLHRKRHRQHDRPAADRVGETGVEVEPGPQAGERRREGRVRLELALAQVVQHGDSGREVGLGKQDVESDRAHAITLEELRGELGQLVARPGPAAQPLQARFVDVDDDDLRVAGVGQGELEPRVVGEPLELGEQCKRALAEVRQRMQQEDPDDGEARQRARRFGEPRDEPR